MYFETVLKVMLMFESKVRYNKCWILCIGVLTPLCNGGNK